MAKLMAGLTSNHSCFYPVNGYCCIILSKLAIYFLTRSQGISTSKSAHFLLLSSNPLLQYDENLCIVILSQIAHGGPKNQRPNLGRVDNSGVTKTLIIFSLRLLSLFVFYCFGICCFGVSIWTNMKTLSRDCFQLGWIRRLARYDEVAGSEYMKWLPLMIPMMMFMDQHAAYTRCLYTTKSYIMMKQRHTGSKLELCQM